MQTIDFNDSRTGTPIDQTETDLCRALWLAVAIQALIDASSKSGKKAAIKEKSDALQWLSDTADENSDLALVCDLAGTDFKTLRKVFKKILRDPACSIDFRCLKKSGVDNRGNESRKRYFARMRKNARLKQDKQSPQNSNDIRNPCSSSESSRDNSACMRLAS